MVNNAILSKPQCNLNATFWFYVKMTSYQPPITLDFVFHCVLDVVLEGPLEVGGDGGW